MTQTKALAVPDPRELVPPGWYDHVAKQILRMTWAELDDAEAMLGAAIGYCQAVQSNRLEFEKALRIVEKRRGDLLPSPGQGARTDKQPRPQAAEVGDVPARTARRYRQIAENWDDIIWPHLQRATNPVECTQAAVMHLVVEHTPAKADADLPDADAGEGSVRVLHGDFRERLLELDAQSVDLIVTDPPYSKDDLPLWSELGQVAAKILGKRGLLFGYTGQIFLPEVLARLGEHLTYGWTFALMLPGQGSRIMGRHMVQGWKPVVAFSTGTWPSGEWGDDVLYSEAREKDEYEWQQNAVPPQRLIERFSPPTGLIVDPFLGVGSFALAARRAGRRFVGVELDAGRFAKASEVLGCWYCD